VAPFRVYQIAITEDYLRIKSWLSTPISYPIFSIFSGMEDPLKVFQFPP